MSDKAQAAKKRAAIAYAKALRRAEREGVNFRKACAAAGEDVTRLDDTRVLLAEKIAKYAGYLEVVFCGWTPS